MTPAKAPPEFNSITAAFALRGNVISVGPCGHGHINETYELVCDDGGQRRRYVLQRINHHVFKNVPALMENVQRVTQHVRAKQPRALALVPLHHGGFVKQDSAGDWWRVYDYVERAITVERVTTEAQAREAARAFGEYQA